MQKPHITVSGRVTKDSVTGATVDVNKKYTKFNVAYTWQKKNHEGIWEDSLVKFYFVTIWHPANMQVSFEKGQKVVVSGEVSHFTLTDKDTGRDSEQTAINIKLPFNGTALVDTTNYYKNGSKEPYIVQNLNTTKTLKSDEIPYYTAQEIDEDVIVDDKVPF